MSGVPASSGRSAGRGGGLDRRLPPVLEVGIVAMVLCIAGVIDLVSHVPRTPDLRPPLGLLAAAAAVVAANVVALARVDDFNWRVFRVVGAWTLLAYGIIAGMLVFTFVYDRLPAGQLSLLAVTLAVFAVDIPMMLAFSVARYQPVQTDGR
ncbi:MAG TPA: hypothetical protein VFA44_04815 [Gaiellaceae bacterium]|nr:hypothetical protein [Gaiellaceae bacterium]